MDQIASALGERARWRIVELLAERPRTVGELAELTGLRQPQTTKHLQTLARAGLVTVFPLGQRRVYALESAPLQSLERRLRELTESTEAHHGERDVIARYRATIDAESAAADRERWADGRTFSFERVLAAPRDTIWRYWTDPDLLASWWAPSPLTITECALEPKPGGRAVLEYREGEQRYRSEGRVHTATEPEHLAFDLSVLDAAGAVSFTGHYDLALAAVPDGTGLRLGLRITETTVEAVPYIAGIETGWCQVLDRLTDTIGKTQHTTTSELTTDKKEAQS
ncbi:metalloregulator ArsR/SmtB family transcription factor [Nocardia uniformis]|uniref:Metalloregulator ArsR/SmtB family transcription factor n=1 Tax=Nocardia uniformis TaxID=53432 RepID=A0A849BQZ0_9NOCA|nr:metalloregulator ArsR/SmtB family transcription factor [Nocardia uniformis]NNH68484.1 metalloregulator ArsR/SmtB family transcription factor [Nocardia uniformis]